MTFINEIIPKPDMGKYEILENDKKFTVGYTSDFSWTIDRERDIYLRNIVRGKIEHSNSSKWAFYWKGELMTICLEKLMVVVSRRTWLGSL